MVNQQSYNQCNIDTNYVLTDRQLYQQIYKQCNVDPTGNQVSIVIKMDFRLRRVWRYQRGCQNP